MAKASTTKSEITPADENLAEFLEDFELNHAIYESLRAIREIFERKSAPLFEDLEQEYLALWSETALRKAKLDEIDTIISDVISNKDRYQSIEDILSLPWYVAAAIHNLEASRRFNAHLHNGDPLSARTTHVPKGRPKTGSPPFSWEESALDALTMKGFDKVESWSIARICYELEQYNGWGYRLYHQSVKSPYLWSYTNHYVAGKYVADGSWSSTAVSKQCGAIALLKRMSDKGIIHIQLGQDQLSYRLGLRNSKTRLLSPRISKAEVRSVATRAADAAFDVADSHSGMPQGSEEEHGGRFFSIDQLDRQSILLRNDSPEQSKPVPEGDPVAFAGEGVDLDRWMWPVVTNNPDASVVSHLNKAGKLFGRAGRRFLAERSGGSRYHVGVDLFCNHRDPVIAMSDGEIVNFYPFYRTNAGEMSYCLIVEHENLVINYGEVKEDAPDEFGWSVGDTISVGDELARVSTTWMLHLETYLPGTTRNHRWTVGGTRPRQLLNPTDILLSLSRQIVSVA